MKMIVVLLGACLLAPSVQAMGAQAPTYQAVALPMLQGAESSWPHAINDRGETVGWARTPADVNYPVIWSTPETVSRIGTLTDQLIASANAINSSGLVAGGAEGAGFTWSPAGGVVRLPMTATYGINDLGVVCGFTGSQGKVWYPDGTVASIGPISGCGYAYARGINNAGRVVGYGATISGSQRAFTWSPSGGLTILTGLGSLYGSASGINNSGQIVGHLYGPGSNTAVVWEPDLVAHRLTMYPGQTSSMGWGINDAGWAVGSVTPSGGYRLPTVWTPDNALVLLPMLEGCDTGEAHSINELGQIVGYCTSMTLGRSYPVLWQPVPEPSSLVALLCAVGGLLGLRKKR